MKRSLIMSMPVLALALGLSACGKNADTKSGGSVSPAALAAAGINTKFVSECGDVAAASSDAAFDLTQCQLSASQMALLQEVGPFSVVADCVHQSVQIKNEAGEISGAGDIKADGTFAVPLTVGERFSVLENCPVKLEGLASGKVACDDNKKLGRVDVNTTFTFSNVPAEGGTAALELVAEQPAPTPAPAPTTPNPAPAPAPSDNHDGDHHGDNDRDHNRDHQGKGGKETGPATPAPGKGGVVLPSTPAQTGKGGKTGEQTPAPGKGGVVVPGNPDQTGKGKGGVVLPSSPAQTGKGGKTGEQVPGKGGQDGNGRHVPASRVDSCVSFTPCGFSTNVALSCTR